MMMLDRLTTRLIDICRTVTAGILGGILPGRSPTGLYRWLSGRPAGSQFIIITTTLGVLLALAMVMVQFGWIGLAAYFAAIVLIVR